MLTVTNVNYNGYKGYDGSGLQGQINLNGKKLCRFYDDSHGAGIQLETKVGAADSVPHSVYKQLIEACAKHQGKEVTWGAGGDQEAHSFISYEDTIFELIKEFEAQPGNSPLEQYLAKELKKAVNQLNKKYVEWRMKGYTLTLYGYEQGCLMGWYSTLAKPGETLPAPADFVAKVKNRECILNHTW